MQDISEQRRFFSEEIEAIANLTTPALVEALARVPREAFLPPGPWMIVGEGDFGGAPRQTPDDEPRRLYHNLSVAIDVERRLFNGAPGIVCTCIDSLRLKPGARVLHIGCGLGYYAALMAQCVGPTGRVVAFEVDEQLADKARVNVAAWPWIEVRHGDASAAFDGKVDAIMSSAGLTHIPDHWLDALVAGGRMVVPLTYSFHPQSAIGKGPVVVIAKSDGYVHEATLRSMIAIYSATGLRDAAMNGKLGEALGRNPFPQLKRLRQDAHEKDAACWLHGDRACLSL